MCGIVAYIGHQDAYPILIKGLKRLEYRGYDSAGVAVIKKDLKVFKYSNNKNESSKKLFTRSSNKDFRHISFINHDYDFDLKSPLKDTKINAKNKKSQNSLVM